MGWGGKGVMEGNGEGRRREVKKKMSLKSHWIVVSQGNDMHLPGNFMAIEMRRRKEIKRRRRRISLG